jgi:hypothetical protein
VYHIARGLLVILIFLGSASAQEQITPLAELRPNAVTTIAIGTFREGNPAHPGSGKVEILRTADGQNIVRLVGLSTLPGPDLFVYLVADPDPLFPEDVTGEFRSLGMLKGHLGDQNYVVPKDVDLSRWGSVVVWCVLYSVPFAVSTIETP